MQWGMADEIGGPREMLANEYQQWVSLHIFFHGKMRWPKELPVGPELAFCDCKLSDAYRARVLDLEDSERKPKK